MLYIASSRNSAFACHTSIQVSLLLSDQLSTILAEKHMKEEWVYLFHIWKSQVGTSSTALVDPEIQGLVLAMKPAAKRVCLKEPLGTTTTLNSIDFSTADIVTDNLDGMEEVQSGLVLLSFTSSKDKTQEEGLENMVQGWDSLVCTVKNFAASFHSIQWKQNFNAEVMDEHMGTLESMVEKCSDALNLSKIQIPLTVSKGSEYLF